MDNFVKAIVMFCGTDCMDCIVYTDLVTAACCLDDHGLWCSPWSRGGCECAMLHLCQHITLAEFSPAAACPSTNYYCSHF